MMKCTVCLLQGTPYCQVNCGNVSQASDCTYDPREDNNETARQIIHDVTHDVMDHFARPRRIEDYGMIEELKGSGKDGTSEL